MQVSNQPSFGMALKIDKSVYKLSEKATDELVKIKPELQELAKDVDIFISKRIGIVQNPNCINDGKPLLVTNVLNVSITKLEPKSIIGKIKHFFAKRSLSKSLIKSKYEDSRVVFEETKKLKGRFLLLS